MKTSFHFSLAANYKFMEKPNILITGSKGVIGTVLVGALAKKFEIYEIDIKGHSQGRYFNADISNLAKLKSVFKRLPRLCAIIHLAVHQGSNENWESVLKTNIIGTRNIYECAKKYKVQRVIFASTNHVTGAYEGFPPKLHKQKRPKSISVNDPVRPDSYYGTSKIFGEAIARQFLELDKISSICLRIGSVTKDDNPVKYKRFARTWLSYRDLIQLVEKSLLSKVSFGIYYGVSNNTGRFWDISNAQKELGYKPKDNASKVIKR